MMARAAGRWDFSLGREAIGLGKQGCDDQDNGACGRLGGSERPCADMGNSVDKGSAGGVVSSQVCSWRNAAGPGTEAFRSKVQGTSRFGDLGRRIN